MHECLLCNSNAVTTRQENSSRTIYNCVQCGVYVVSDLIVKQVEAHLPEISAFLRHRQISKNSDVVLLSFDKAQLDKGYLQLTVDQVVDSFPKSFTEQMEKTLENLVLLSKYPGDELRLESLDSAPVFYLKHLSLDAMSFCIRAMAKEELIEVNYYNSAFFPCGVIVSAKGWDLASGLKTEKTGSRSSVIMFTGSAKVEDDANMKSSAEKAAKENKMQFINSYTISSEGGIRGGLDAAVRSCACVFIDLSSQNEQSYYAMGYARALNKPLLLTCHEKEREKLKLDPVRNGVIFWYDHKQLQLEYTNFIKAYI